jgi:hypothetical protein
MIVDTNTLTAAQLAAAARGDEERLLGLAAVLRREGQHQRAAEITGAVESLRAVRRAYETRLPREIWG